jgi:hypothetical protein
MSSKYDLPTLGRLVTVPIRSVWASEPHVFDPWLSQPENLQFLADALGLPGLELLNAQSAVGPFFADLVCRVVGTDHKVVIENQLDKADHRHLGQVLTYAPHHDAKICVWVAAEICDEHRAAVDWLNRISNDDFGFFAVEVRAVRIGDSLPAPLFDVVAKPNDFAKLAPESSSGGPLSSYAATNIEFWRLLHPKLKAAGGATRRSDGDLKDSNYWGPLTDKGSDAYVLAWRSQSAHPNVGAYVGLYGNRAAHVWQSLLERRDAFDEAVGEPLRWEANQTGTNCKIMVEPLYSDTAPENWPAQTDWLVDKMVKLKSAFEQPIRMALAEVDLTEG